MDDDLKETGREDAAPIDIEPGHEARYWADWFDASAIHTARPKGSPLAGEIPPGEIDGR